MCSARSELVRVSPHVLPAGHHIPVTLPPTWLGPRPPVEEWGRRVMPSSPPARLSLALCGHVKQFLRQIGSYLVSGHHLKFCAFCVRNQTNIYILCLLKIRPSFTICICTFLRISHDFLHNFFPQQSRLWPRPSPLIPALLQGTTAARQQPQIRDAINILHSSFIHILGVPLLVRCWTGWFGWDEKISSRIFNEIVNEKLDD